jgi:hypothetical protein
MKSTVYTSVVRRSGHSGNWEDAVEIVVAGRVLQEQRCQLKGHGRNCGKWKNTVGTVIAGKTQ